MVDAIIETERRLPNKHLIAQQVEGGAPQGPVDFTGDARVPIMLGQYTWQNVNQVGALKLLDNEYDHNKMIELNETMVYPVWYKIGDPIASSRVEAWEFIVGGGGSFNQLNSLYTTVNPAARDTDTATLMAALRQLQRFMHSFDFIKMRRDTTFVASALPEGVFARSISEPGKQYALYMHHSKNLNMYYEVLPGSYQEELALNMPPGHYRLEWVDPATGNALRADEIAHAGGTRPATTPTYTMDMALRVKSVG
jgi:hypothetical protein